MNKTKRLIVALPLLIVVGYILVVGFRWTVERVFVGPDEALVVINKFGQAPAGDMVVIPADGTQYKGVQQELRGPGRYFLNPIEYDWKIVPQVVIPAGDPSHWEWDGKGELKDPSTAPMIGVVSLKQGKTAPAGLEVVPAGFRGIQQQVLTPGTYKINPYLYDVKIEPATVVPPGSVGVLTQQVVPASAPGDAADGSAVALNAPATTEPAATTEPSRIASGPNQRGIMPKVLQPGVYYLNPRMVKVTIVSVGFDQITLQHEDNTAIRFTSSDAYQVECDLTVVWGRDPIDAPSLVANIGNTEQIEQNVIRPAMKAACQNEGGKFTAKQLIEGETRSKFQDQLQGDLDHDVKGRNLHILLALVRNVEIKDSTGKDQTRTLLGTIQQANIEIENELTNQQKTKTATVQAELQQAERSVDVARETVVSGSNVKVAQVLAEGQKKAAEIDADRELQVATIQQQVALLDAQRTQILGKANADVDRMKRESEAKGAKLLIDAFGSPQAYNLYTFAKNFSPKDLKLIFAGPGTLWTDLKTFQDVGAGQLIPQTLKMQENTGK